MPSCNLNQPNYLDFCHGAVPKTSQWRAEFAMFFIRANRLPKSRESNLVSLDGKKASSILSMIFHATIPPVTLN
jgi:hypothetical protein